jgi:hypothetical protein
LGRKCNCATTRASLEVDAEKPALKTTSDGKGHRAAILPSMLIALAACAPAPLPLGNTSGSAGGGRSGSGGGWPGAGSGGSALGGTTASGGSTPTDAPGGMDGSAAGSGGSLGAGATGGASGSGGTGSGGIATGGMATAGATGSGGVAGGGGTTSTGGTRAGGGGTGTGGVGGSKYPFILSCFNDDNTHASDLMIYTSSDALNWTLLYDTGYTGPTGFMRDPSIMRHTDGKYYVAFTTPPDLGCCGSQQSFSIGSSSNLKDWTTIATVASGIQGTKNTWSPEWFVDTDGSVHITATVNDAIYRYEPTDSTLTKWSSPKAMGITGTIDAQVIKVGSTYHMLLSNQRQIASSLDGPWTRDDSFVPPSCKEGPAIVHITGDTWRYYCDDGGSTHESSSLTTDLFKTWGPLATLPVVGKQISQGTVIRGDTGHPF